MYVKDKLRIMKEIDAANRESIEDWRKSYMGERKIRGVLIDVKKGTASDVTMDKSLDAYYEALNCRCIDIASRKIGGVRFDIISDDEGAILDSPIPSGISPQNEVQFYGNLFVVKFDGKEDVESLTDEDVRHILHNTRPIIISREKGLKVVKALTNVEYC